MTSWQNLQMSSAKQPNSLGYMYVVLEEFYECIHGFCLEMLLVFDFNRKVENHLNFRVNYTN